MPKPVIYLDHAATTPVRTEVLEAMQPFFSERYGNPSSLHQAGRQAGKAMAQAREQIASLLQADTPDSILFTSSATEANNLALKGLAFSLKHHGQHLITSAIEHPSVLEPMKWLQSQGWEVTWLPVDADGVVSPESLAKAIRPDTVLVSVMHGNNEIGALQPIEALGAIAHEHGVLFHTDAVQTLGKLPLDLQALPVDLLSASGHKLYGPKGIGFLYANSKARAALTPWLHGGGQEGGLRSGTENVPGIVGLAAALACALDERVSTVAQLRELQEVLLAGILRQAPSARINGPREINRRIPGNINVSFPPIEGETLVLRFDLEGVCVSSGSACHHGRLTGSDVLRALGCSEEEAKSSVRFSIGRDTTLKDVQHVLDVLPRVLQKSGYYRDCTPRPLNQEAKAPCATAFSQNHGGGD